jgi:7,8-dihydropterin-6-yl-methyl-4-(beta-D-ribofuranosyl)aminobenzene 5'-phosphate synthase
MTHWIRNLVVALVLGTVGAVAAENGAGRTQVRSLKVTILSTLLAEGDELGEWGFAALVEADGRRILFDTGAKADVVLKNTQTMKVDLSGVQDVVLSHWHGDHVGGFLTLRRDARAKSAQALGRAHVGAGIFQPRFGGPPNVDMNPMSRLKGEYEAGGGTFVEHAKPVELFPGGWLTGPVPRKHPERNWSGRARVRGPDGGLVDDTIADDMALVIDTAEGLVIVTGCGHAGVINIVEHARAVVRPVRVHALIGGIHLFNASEPTLQWTTARLREFGLDHFIGAHCTGIETVYRFRADLGLARARCVVGAVGASFELGKGIEPLAIAK